MVRHAVEALAVVLFACTSPVRIEPAVAVPEEPAPGREISLALTRSALRPMPDPAVLSLSALPGLPENLSAVAATNRRLLRETLEENGIAFIDSNFDPGRFRAHATELFREHLGKMTEFFETHARALAVQAQGKNLSIWLATPAGQFQRIEASFGRRFLSRTLDLTLWTDSNGDGTFERSEEMDLSSLSQAQGPQSATQRANACLPAGRREHANGPTG